jgi:hypothetical protein
MISPFGVEHGYEPIEKLGGPKYRGYALTVHERDKKSGKTTTHHPDEMIVRDTGKKSLILRREKYDFTTSPGMKYDGKKNDYFVSRSPKLGPDRKSLKEIHAHVSSKSGTKPKNIRGLKVSRLKDN